ncbi:MAG TPA: hypothetical protein VK879_09420, partial [Candidatus Sulfomarinibacteraceae bacterium]|nr:hypothetical protein [Candidatus Sulfomarinibacteraceae bacterium]
MPRVVEALPGRYLVRLQNHPLTSGVVELVTTPLPRSLPAAEGVDRVSVAADQLPDIPGLSDNDSALAAEATPSPTPTEMVEELVSPTPEATEPPPTPT